MIEVPATPRISLIPCVEKAKKPTRARGHNDIDPIRYLHPVIATDADSANAQLASGRMTGSSCAAVLQCVDSRRPLTPGDGLLFWWTQ